MFLGIKMCGVVVMAFEIWAKIILREVWAVLVGRKTLRRLRVESTAYVTTFWLKLIDWTISELGKKCM